MVGLWAEDRMLVETNKNYSGGITRMYAYTDSSKQDHYIWTTFYSQYNHDYINIFLKAHEEAHVVQKLKRTDELIKQIQTAYPFVNKKDLDSGQEELLSNLGGFIPFAEHGISSLLLLLDDAAMTDIIEFDEALDLINR